MASSRPHITLSAAVSLDGKIATKSGDSAFSSRQDKMRIHKLRAKSDAILVGKNTVEIDDPLLTVRYARGKNPTRVILDSRAEISPSSRIIKTSGSVPTIIAVSKNAPKKNLARLGRYPIQVITAGKNRVEIEKLLQILHRQKIRTILLEGGGITNWEFIQKNLVDEAIVTITPYLVGGISARSLVEGSGFSKIAGAFKLKLKKVQRQNNEIVLHYS
ncbi:MAG: 2,5-diamino-6-(ribosylamino)-4(3H)-pyrimidinone 5'-phosphate reductase [Candidatus Nitrosotenuis sp.]